MSDNKKSYCLIGLHRDEIHEKLPLTDLRGNTIGTVIINRCLNCGRIGSKKVRTVELNYT